MITSVEAVYRDGKVELLDPAPEQAETHRVVVTFLPRHGTIDLAAHGITPQRAAKLRASFGVAAEDWDHPDMDVYDDLSAG